MIQHMYKSVRCQSNFQVLAPLMTILLVLIITEEFITIRRLGTIAVMHNDSIQYSSNSKYICIYGGALCVMKIGKLGSNPE